MTGNTERTANMVPSLVAKSNAGDNADVIIWADPSTHRLLVNASVTVGAISGSKSNNNAAPGSDNIGALVGVATAAAPSYTEGNLVALSTDLAGALRVTGSLSVGGTTDNSAFTAGTSTGTPTMGFYHSTVDSVTDGRSAVIGMTVKRAMFVSLYDASGNALLGQKTSANSVPVALASDASLAVTNAGTFAVQATLAAETTKVIGTVRVLGNAGAIVDGVNTAATAPANGILGLGIYNSTEPSPTTGQSVGIQLDSKGRQRQVIMDAAGNTRGANVNASNQLSVSVDNTVTVGTHAVTIASGGVASGAIASGAFASGSIGSGAIASGAVASGAFASGSIASGAIAAGAIAAGATSIAENEDVASANGDRGVKVLAVRKATPANTSGTDGDYEFFQISAGRLWTSANIDQINGITPLMGNGVTGTGSLRVTIASDNSNAAGIGGSATGSAVPSAARYVGGNAITSLPSAATAGNLTGMSTDKFGRQVTLVGTIRDLTGTQTTTISASTSETTIVTAAGSGVFADLIMLIVSNTSASTNTRIDFRDATGGSVLFSLQSNGGQPPVGFALSIPIPQTTANNNWTAQCATSTTDIRVYAVYAKNK